MDVLVSIICITYNQEKYIKQAIDSFLMQKTDFDYEIIIGEDCSIDSTKKIIEEYVKKYPQKIKLITSDNNVGFMKNLKRVFEVAKGDYIAICEGDDYWTDEYKLQKQISYMRNHTDCSLCFHNAEILNDINNKIIGSIKNEKENKIYNASEVIDGKGGFIPTQSIVIKKDVIKKLPKWYWTSSVGDYPLQVIASLNGYVYYINENMSIYRTNINTAWTAKYEKSQNNKIIMKNSQGMVDIMNNISTYTYGKYSEEINRVKIPHEINICVLNGNIRGIRRYKNTEYYSKLSKKEKVKMYIKALNPNIYSKIVNIIKMVG